ncbi:MAG: type II toxin-antitoxin system RelE/ParE family toxin [Defluviitaleaceae bacterium]|nr:type II toxin-antitoxin system RelE/ParE family toxin [Defluviitaleaceae bacterium]
MMDVVWTPSALGDLNKIKEYIARDSVHYANKFAEGAFTATEHLAVFPKRGRIVPEYQNPNIREIGHGSYRIIYEMVDDEVFVVAIVHGRRLLPGDFREVNLDEN